MKEEYQIVAVGGGIMGTGVAREAAARGYKTLLVEKTDFGHATSGHSSKLIHGGFRYLEHGFFRLIRESLRERRALIAIAPHLVRPMRFVIPVYKGARRPAWMVHIGCKLYDWFAGSQNLTPSHRLTRDELRAVPGLLKTGLKAAFHYSDAQTDDSRLCLETALSAESYGADIHNHMELVDVDREQDGFALTLLDRRTNATRRVRTRFLVNAGGPWAPGMDGRIHVGSPTELVYVRGIHLVIRDRVDDKGYFLILPDGRIVFVLPWKERYTLIGTTETDYHGTDFDHVPPSEEEKDYLRDTFNHYFPDHAFGPDQVLFVYSAVRSLIKSEKKNFSSMSREYVLKLETLGPNSGYAAVYGGKLTTYRAMGAKVMDFVGRHLAPAGPGGRDTEHDPLVGAVPPADAETRRLEQGLASAGVAPEVIKRWKRIYGTRWAAIAGLALESEENREPIVPHTEDDYLFAELLYQVAIEKALTLEDIILRRTKLIYDLDKEGRTLLEDALGRALDKVSVK